MKAVPNITERGRFWNSILTQNVLRSKNLAVPSEPEQQPAWNSEPLVEKPHDLTDAVILVALLLGFILLIADALGGLIAEAAPRYASLWLLTVLVAWGVLTFTVEDAALPILAFAVVFVTFGAGTVERGREELRKARDRKRANNADDDKTASGGPPPA